MTESTSAGHLRHEQAGSLQRAARWLLAAAVLLILYGSLFPFEFTPRADRPFSELAASLAFQRASRGDVVANLLLYVPLGLCMAIALPHRWSAAAKIALTVATGVLLSIAVELVQTMEAARVASLTDVLLNAAGTAMGAAAVLAYVALGTHVRVPGLIESRPAPVPLGLVLLWLCYRLAPFVPTLDWQKFKDSLKPVFLNPSIHAFDVLRFLVGWLVIAHAARLIWRREFAVLAIVTLAAGTQLGRVLVVGKELNPAELVAIAVMFALLPLVQRLPDARQLVLLSIAIAGVVLIQGLEPWRLDAAGHGFSWVPFMNSLSDSLEVNVGVLLEKCFWYASLVWLLARCTGSLGSSALAAALLVGAIEFVQMWLPGRSAEITDPLLVLAAAGLLRLIAVTGTQPVSASPSPSP